MPEQPSKLLPAVYGGLLIGAIGGLPFLSWINCACCSGALAGGFLAVHLFRRDLDLRYHMDMSDGAQLGLMAGVFGAVLATALSQLFTSVTFEMVQKIVGTYLQDPELEAMFDRIRPELFARSMIFIGLIFNLIAYSIFGLIGGLIGVSMIGKSKTPYGQPTDQRLPPPMPPPTIPPEQDSSNDPL